MAEEALPKEQLLLKMLKMTTSDNDGQALVAIRKANQLLDAAGWSWDKLIAGKIKVVANPFSNLATPNAGPKAMEPAAPSASRQRPFMPSSSPGKGREWTWDNSSDSWITRPAVGRSSSTARPSRPSSAPRLGMMWWFDTSLGDWVQTQDPNYVAPAPRPAPQRGLGLTRSNMYAKHCYCCGDYVDNQKGFIIKPEDFNPIAKGRSQSGWDVVCTDCNRTRAGIPNKPAMKNTGQTTSTSTGPAPSLGEL